VSQLRSVLGNLSAPLLLVAFFAGIQSRRIWVAALLGLLATMAALLTFYLFTTALIDLAGNGYVDNLRLELIANKVYFEGGLVSGLLFGSLGGWWSRTKPVRLSILVGAVLMVEPLVLILLAVVLPGGVAGPESGLPLLIRIIPGWGLSIDSGPETIAVYTVEFVAGLVTVLFGVRRARRDRRAASADPVPTPV
jgi:hypothetical protein